MTARCRCRPGCLAPLKPTDLTVQTPNGPALPPHVELVPAYPVEGLTSLASPLSKVRAS